MPVTVDKPEQLESWDLVLHPRTRWFDLHLGDLLRYRDLIWLFVKRDFITFYKQTILGPLWYILQPLLTTVVFTVIFGKFGKIPTDGIPRFIFYLSGTVTWSYFANCLSQTSNTFIKNAGVFGKVYFPRLSVPISVVIINLAKFSIQFIVFLTFYTYSIVKGASIRPGLFILLLPVLVFQMALLSFGTGILVSSLTTKYRDLNFVMTFAVQLWMYGSSVIIPASVVAEKVSTRWLYVYMLNPMVSIVEMFRYAFFGEGLVKPVFIAMGWCVTLLVLFAGVTLFGRIEKNFMDTI